MEGATLRTVAVEATQKAGMTCPASRTEVLLVFSTFNPVPG